MSIASNLSALSRIERFSVILAGKLSAVSYQLSAKNEEKAGMKDFRELKAWQKAHRFALDVYAATAGFPRTETYGLTSQIRRSSLSIPSNLAEGCGRGSDAELARFVQIAVGSSSEAEYQLLLARDLGFMNEESYIRLNAQVCEIKKMLTSFLQTLRTKN